MTRRASRYATGAALLLVLALVLGVRAAGVPGAPAVPARPLAAAGGAGTGTAAGTVALSALPAPARTVIAQIDAGGPFAYRSDGAVFANREHELPAHPGGWYREYTVATPGQRDRGARRLVRGRDGTLWWSQDHYATFSLVARDR